MKIFLLCSLLLGFPVMAAERVALVIGNGLYDPTKPFTDLQSIRGNPNLINPVPDAQLVAKTFQSLGFSVILLENATKQQIATALEKFKTAATGAKLGVIYYAGHGTANKTVNYILPVDAKFTPSTERGATEADREADFAGQLSTRAISHKELLAALGETSVDARVLVLDCCRDNNIATRAFGLSRGGEQSGPVPVEKSKLPKASLIMFSAGPGQVAKDGLIPLDNTGRLVPGNSPFTKAFAAQIAATQSDVFDALRKVAIAVQQEVPTQEPWLETDGSVVALSAVSFLPAGMKPRALPPAVDPVMAARLAEAERQLAELKKTRAMSVPSKAVPATGDRGFTNTLGMKFVPVPGTEVLFCIHETRSKDYAAFMADRNRGYTMSGTDVENWRIFKYKNVPVGRGETEKAEVSNHPVANVSWLDAVAFCEWLSKKEGKTYRLPTDSEWSVAVGIPQEGSGTPGVLDSKIKDVYPWTGSFVSASIQGNYSDSAAGTAFGKDWSVISGYQDGYASTAPVMSFTANQNGLYDMGGNLWEWCAGCYDGQDPSGKNKSLNENRVVRGGSWYNGVPTRLLSSYRFGGLPKVRYLYYGFRVVVGEGSGG